MNAGFEDRLIPETVGAARAKASPAVPARLVIASIVALWTCYFVLATLRGALLGYDHDWDLLSRRFIVTLASMAITALLWPLLALIGRWPLWWRIGVILIAALPLALLLAGMNNQVFAARTDKEHTRIDTSDGVSVITGESGTFVLGLPEKPPPPPPPPPPESASGAASDRAIDRKSVETRRASISVTKVKQGGFWEESADLAIGRYFLLLAWAAVYLALANAEQARAAERREGDFRRAAQAAELRSLRYQVNPHFLFNTLNSLSALVLTGRTEAAERMIQMLSGFYRRSLVGDPTGDLTLGEEIALQRLYLDIETVRFPERLRSRFDIPEELTDACMPGMILQPLIENAIKHAVSVYTQPVTITIAATTEQDNLVLTVSDDGPGALGRSPGLGIGLANVRDRLQARFGEAASLDVGGLQGGGFRAVIRMPLLRRDGLDG